jgi:GNAT superfamily N-acetyltransferase
MDDPLEYEFFLKPNSDEELGRYVIGFFGKAVHWNDSGAEHTVGEISGHRIDLISAAHDGNDQSLLFDSVAPEISDFSETVLLNADCILPELAEAAAEQVECECLVFVSELKVAESQRGRGVGSALLKRMGSMIDLTNCLVALKAFPLSDDYGTAAHLDEIARVKKFYERHGFIHAGGEFMVKDARLCDAMKKKLARRRNSI